MKQQFILFFFDCRAAWQAVGDLSRPAAMAQFVTLLDRVCPPLRDMLMDVSQKYRCETSTQFIHNGSKA
jgi:hypothetical protein